MDSELKDYLLKNNIEYKEYKHPPIYRVVQGIELKKDIPATCSKNLFLKDNFDNFYLVCMPCLKRLNLRHLQTHLKVKKLSFASPEELMKHLKVLPGSVSLFCMIYSAKVNLIIDKELWDAEFTGYHPNINTSTLVISKSNLHKFFESLKCKKEVLELE